MLPTLAGDDDGGLPLMELLRLGPHVGGRVAEEELAGVEENGVWFTLGLAWSL